MIARVESELPGCAEHLAVLLHLLSLRSEAHPMPAAAANRPQVAILTALQAVFAALAQARPVVLLLSDWHWADPASEQALHHLAEGLAARRLMLVVNFRSYYQPHWGPAVTRIDLPPLHADDMRPIVHRIVGGAAPEALLRRIFERTGGESACSSRRSPTRSSTSDPPVEPTRSDWWRAPSRTTSRRCCARGSTACHPRASRC